MKFLKAHIGGIALFLLELIVGILLLINPVGFTTGIIMVAGIVMMVVGLVEVIQYFRADKKEAILGQLLTRGLLLLLAGGFCLFQTQWFLVTFPVLTILYGVIILVTGVSKVQMTVDMIRMKNGKWVWAALGAVVSIVCAIVILQNPFASTAALWMFVGITLIVESVLDIVTMILGRKGTRKDPA